MAQLDTLKSLLDNPDVSDAVLEFYLSLASEVICDRRNSDIVEPQYLNVQVQMAIEMFSKRGAEGQLSHSENGIGRSYESADISPSLLAKVTPVAKTPFSIKRVIS